MSQIHYAMSYQCDCCGVMAIVNPPQDHMKMRHVPIPEGWMTYNKLPNNENIEFTVILRGGRSLYHPDLCTSCQNLPYKTVIERMVQRHELNDS